MPNFFIEKNFVLVIDWKYIKKMYNINIYIYFFSLLFIGPISLINMVIGLLLSGFIISKFKPSPRPLLAWNVFVGICFVLGQISFIFLGCTDSGIHGMDLETMQ